MAEMTRTEEDAVRVAVEALVSLMSLSECDTEEAISEYGTEEAVKETVKGLLKCARIAETLTRYGFCTSLLARVSDGKLRAGVCRLDSVTDVLSKLTEEEG